MSYILTNLPPKTIYETKKEKEEQALTIKASQYINDLIHTFKIWDFKEWKQITMT